MVGMKSCDHTGCIWISLDTPDLGPTSGTMDIRWEYTLDGTP